ncbi:terminase small subunit [Limosilactobacillus coleohominis 101-4-CHN]|uniref:Terminase small subunit n=1 Tax=Limosilactobacillus coleohominis 101-4-CHN TaxID=575594 RepID=C7XUU1_9LACO|nr:terminase small subunit [Limosilactobacillus coleohominis]EEU31052.1 terminase small subunit [Limosilactobacillus coleohominis 101-4-CHN]
MKLTQKQRLFADEYIKSGNATDAYVKAGYKCSRSTARRNGNRLLTNADIKSYIANRTAEIESHKIADAKEVLQYYTRVLRAEETEKVVDVVNGGLIESPPTIKERTSAAKELMKRYPLSDPMAQVKLKKLSADTRISEAKARVLERVDDASNEQLDAILNKLIEEVPKQNGNSESNDQETDSSSE